MLTASLASQSPWLKKWEILFPNVYEFHLVEQKSVHFHTCLCTHHPSERAKVLDSSVVYHSLQHYGL